MHEVQSVFGVDGVSRGSCGADSQGGVERGGESATAVSEV